MFFADVTTMNFNVTFEIAYAIGLGKRVHLVRDQNIARETSLITKIGIFDTLGFISYAEGLGLARILQGATPENPLPLRVEPNKKAPVYILNTPTSNAPMLAIGARVKKSRLGFRSFIPQEEIRMSASKAIVDISACIGAIVPMLPSKWAQAVRACRAALAEEATAQEARRLFRLAAIEEGMFLSNHEGAD